MFSGEIICGMSPWVFCAHHLLISLAVVSGFVWSNGWSELWKLAVASDEKSVVRV